MKKYLFILFIVIIGISAFFLVSPAKANACGEATCWGYCDYVSGCDYPTTCSSTESCSYTYYASYSTGACVEDPACSPADTDPPSVGNIIQTSAVQGVVTQFSVYVTDDVGVTGCTLYVDNSSTGSMSLWPSTPCTTSDCRAYADYTFANTGSYQMKARCDDAAGNSAYGTNVPITVAGAAPSAPTLSSPANNSTGVSTTPTLSWSETAPPGGGYNLYYKKSTDTSWTGFALVSNSYSFYTDLSSGTVYRWRVNACDPFGSANCSGYSATWSFTTITVTPTPAPICAPGEIRYICTGTSCNL